MTLDEYHDELLDEDVHFRVIYSLRYTMPKIVDNYVRAIAKKRGITLDGEEATNDR